MHDRTQQFDSADLNVLFCREADVDVFSAWTVYRPSSAFGVGRECGGDAPALAHAEVEPADALGRG
ncbi:hypothetical protein, partial [Amycolatopsis sp.]|uniref:hypothetical protein n=1 Tax=Amycolatopsis sp. TaxID=37632 RepID=UPI002D7FD3EB